MKLEEYRKKLSEYISLITEEYIHEFGQENKDKILRRISLVGTYFENSYYYEYEYIKEHSCDYQEAEIALIKHKKKMEEYRLNSLRYELNRKMNTIIKNILGISLEEDNYNDFFNNFYYLEGSLIDYFGNMAEIILNDRNTPYDVIIDILNKRKEFINKYHITPTSEEVELLRVSLDLVRDKYFRVFTRETNSGNKFMTHVEETLGTVCSHDNLPDYLYSVVTSEFRATLASFTVIPNGETMSFNENKKRGIITLPLAKVAKFYGFEYAIHTLVHELGHSICYDDKLTASQYVQNKCKEEPLKKEYEFFLELINENRAKRVTSRLLNKPYDTRNSSYDIILPLVKPFLDTYRKLINELDINGASVTDYINIFGPSFEKLITSLYYEYQKVTFYSYKIIDNAKKPITYNDKVKEDISLIIEDISEYFALNNGNKNIYRYRKKR